LIESQCYWATIKESWTGEKYNTSFEKYTNKKDLKLNNNVVENKKHQSCYVKQSNILNARKSNLVYQDLPSNWFWGDVNGTNYLSWNKQQHIPQWCGSCWAQASTSALADRTNILVNNSFDWNLSPQVVMNCNAGGSCNGGDPYLVYQFAHDHGIPHDSCQTYLASNPKDATCSGTWVCEDCTSPVGSTENCKAYEPTYVYASEYGAVTGVLNMKQEIYQRGPIACGIVANDTLMN